MNPQGPKYQQKSKAIFSAEPNYFVHFAMRYPVIDNKIKFFDLLLKLSTNQNTAAVVNITKLCYHLLKHFQKVVPYTVTSK